MIDDTFASVSLKLSPAKHPSSGPYSGDDPAENGGRLGLVRQVKTEIKRRNDTGLLLQLRAAQSRPRRLFNRLPGASGDVRAGSFSQSTCQRMPVGLILDAMIFDHVSLGCCCCMHDNAGILGDWPKG